MPAVDPHPHWDRSRLILLDGPRAVRQEEVEDGREDEVEQGDGGGPDEVEDGTEDGERESEEQHESDDCESEEDPGNTEL